MIEIKILPHDDALPGKPIAAAELHFTYGPLRGMKLIGFTLWRNRNNVVTVGFPSRSYSVAGERRSFALLRPVDPHITAEQDDVRQLIKQKYLDCEAQREAAKKGNR